MQRFASSTLKSEQLTTTQASHNQTMELNAPYPSGVSQRNQRGAQSCHGFAGTLADSSNCAVESFVLTDPSVASNSANGTALPPEFVITRPSCAQHCHQPSATQPNELPTHPVPEFLCHVLSIVQDPMLSHIISWEVNDESAGSRVDKDIQGAGKVVIHDPMQFEQQVLGKFYRHSKFSSFQRQMNYFGFRKRVLNGGRGKMHACEFVNAKLGRDPTSLLGLKRRMKHTAKSGGAKEGKLHDSKHGKSESEKCPYKNVRGNRFSCIASASDDAQVFSLSQTMMGNPVSGNALELDQSQCIRPKCAPDSVNITQMPPSFLFNQMFMNQSFPINPMPNSFQSHSKMSSAVCPQLLHNNFSNPSINGGNMNTNQATVAAQEAKQSLFQAYQQSQLDLLRNDMNRSSRIAYQTRPAFGVPLNENGTLQYKKEMDRITTHVSVVTHPDDGLKADTSPLLAPVVATDPLLPGENEKPIPLPSSIAELFDEGSVCSLLCDEDELKDADDCSMLSVELGLVG